MTDLEKLQLRFHQDMISIYKTAKAECGYTPTRFLQLVTASGGVSAARQLICKSGGTDGFATLWACGRLDLSVEAFVLKPEYEPLFTPEERSICRARLTEYGYHC